MSWFGKLFGKKKAESVALIEIGSDSIAGGFVHFKEGDVPILVYANRTTIAPTQGEEPLAAVTRTLNTLGESLIREGAPLLARAVGSGRIDAVLVSVKAPWQETTVRSEKIERTAPFLFTRALLHTALAKSAETPPGRRLADEMVVGTILDGYETKVPVGKRASRANIVILSSFIDQPLSEAIAASLRNLFHCDCIRLVAAAALRYEALRALFPHEVDYLMIDAAGDAIVTALVRRGLLSAVEHGAAANSKEKDAWLTALTATLEALTKRYPLPRKFFLIAGEAERASLKEKLETAPLASLRLSEEPSVVLAITPAQLTDHVKLADAVIPDLGLELMVMFWRKVQA
ncbi:MAG: hypothetical protein Q7R54_00235 [bacterium]|nr:hypothetical protein [bacterium]